MNILKEEVLEIFENSKRTISDSKQITDKILLAVDEIANCIKNKNKIIIFGNGGSAADAQHMAAEFIGRYLLERQSFPAIALTTDTSVLTAIGNDYDFDEIFARQCDALVNKGDIVFAISTSGKSKNVIQGIRKGKEKGAKIISITGINGNDMEAISDIILKIPSENTPRIQEGHKVVIHIICELVEKICK